MKIHSRFIARPLNRFTHIESIHSRWIASTWSSSLSNGHESIQRTRFNGFKFNRRHRVSTFAVLGHSCPFLASERAWSMECFSANCNWHDVTPETHLDAKLKDLHLRKKKKEEEEETSHTSIFFLVGGGEGGQALPAEFQKLIILLLLRFAVELAHVDPVVCSTEGACTKICYSKLAFQKTSESAKFRSQARMFLTPGHVLIMFVLSNQAFYIALLKGIFLRKVWRS